MIYLKFFIAIALALSVQLFLTARQSQAFMRQVTELRRHGRVAIGLGRRHWFGRKVYVALAATSNGRVTHAILLRGVTQFARAKPAPNLVGVTLRTLASEKPVPGCGRLERAAAQQAATTLRGSPEPPTGSPEPRSTAGGWHPTGGADQGREGAQSVSSPVK